MRFAKFQFGSDIDTIQPMTEFFRSAKNILIVLPVGYDEAIIAGDILTSACRKIPDLHVTVIHSSTRETSLASLPKTQVIRLHADDLNRFKLPTRNLLQRVMVRTYDVAVNLNLDFVLHTAYICKASRARVRVGGTHPDADFFYNVQFNVRKDLPPQARYQHFAACVTMF
jgi:ADP-heptose:LPS heptosyltransferase